MKSEKNKEEIYSLKTAFGYGIGQFSDTIALQMFVFFIFTFYYAVVGISVNLITIGYIIWSIWNSINDPLLGALSDRTNTKWGRRTPYIMVSVIPLCIIMVLLWTPPLDSEMNSFLYFIIVIILFDFTYTMYDLNYASLFPEMFQDLENRAKANSVKQLFTIFGLLFTFILPTLIIPRLDSRQYYPLWGSVGLLMSVVIGIGALILIKFGLKERKEFSQDYRSAPPLLRSLKYSLKNKSFRYFIVSNLAYWYVIGMLSTIVPLYGIFVLGIGEDSILLGLLLGAAFVSAAGFILFWQGIARKLGMKKGIMLSMIIYIIVLIPFMFISDVPSGFVAFIFVGIGIAGGLLFGDILLGAVIDEDEIETGTRREGGYYGINALITKLSTILVILSINLIFNSVGWTYFDPKGTTEATILGLRLLVFLFPTIALSIGILSISRFPIHQARYEEIKTQIAALHKKKRQQQHVE
ncbi:MAG: MFS transporter [Promethearchaeota archaeon]|nr:MAG: MFS transporter [Candidatus Lokiarchaeota archaeon]